MAVLEGLPGIRHVEMLLERDAFEIEYEPERVSVDVIESRIRRLGYEPRRAERAAAAEREAEPRGPLPEPVAPVARAAAAASRLLCLDFYASWCGPCKVLEKTILPAPEVQKALAHYEFVRVDTDKYPEAAAHFEVVGLPTLVVIDAAGNERFRHLGPISAPALARALDEARRSGGKD